MKNELKTEEERINRIFKNLNSLKEKYEAIMELHRTVNCAHVCCNDCPFSLVSGCGHVKLYDILVKTKGYTY